MTLLCLFFLTDEKLLYIGEPLSLIYFFFSLHSQERCYSWF